MEKYINSLIRGFKKIFNKKYFAIVSVFIGIVTVLGVSYGYLSSESGWQLAAQLRISKLYYSIAVDGVSTNEIVAAANSGTTYYNVEITSLNDINTRYALTYKVTGTATVGVSSSSTNAGSGVIGLYSTGTNTEKKKTVRVAVTNNSSSTATVTLSIAGGYTWNPENQISVKTGYAIVSGINYESQIGIGLTLAEEIDEILGCTPTASTPCYYTNNSNNYLTYANNTWRIIGIYLVNSKPVVKAILNEPLTSKVTYANVSSTLTTFYNGLSDKTLIQGTATSLTKAEYDAIGGVNSYLYTKPDKDYWTGTQYYVGTSRGAVNKTSSYTAYVRPVIQLKDTVVNANVGEYGTSSNPYEIVQGVAVTVEGMDNVTSNIVSGYIAPGKTYTLSAVHNDSDYSLDSWQVSGTGSSINNGILTMGTGETTITPVWKATFNYTGTYKLYTAYKDGYYFIETFGAQGGTAICNDNVCGYGGKGGYSTGYIYLSEGEKLYIYVGGKGANSQIGNATTAGGWNGGGNGTSDGADGEVSGAGGGATDIRYFGNATPTSSDLAWNSSLGLNSRIMVAGGGAGSAWYLKAGDGGGLIGERSIGTTGATANTTQDAEPGRQTTGYQFGKGQDGSGGGADSDGVPGAGGGYYGGQSLSTHPSSSKIENASGGSSFISGYAGSNAITSASNRTHTNNTLHYSGKYFLDGTMKSGVREGNGQAKIKYVGLLPRTNTKLNNVRYIKDCGDGNTVNAGKFWVEIQAIKDGINIAKNKTITATGTIQTNYGAGTITAVVDGLMDDTFQYAGIGSSGTHCVTVDLGASYNLDEVVVWHYYAEGRTYYNNTTFVSSNNSTWSEILNQTIPESANGKRVTAYSEPVVGYIQNGLVVWYDGISNTGTTRSTSTTTWKNLAGSSYDGTITRGTWGDKYLIFDGSSTWVKIAQLNYNVFTLESVAKQNSIGSGEKVLMSNFNSGGYGIYLYNSIPGVEAHISGDWETFEPSNVTWDTTKINSLSGSFNGMIFSLAENGVINKSSSYSNTPLTITTPTSSTVMAVGVNPSGSNAESGYLNGNVYSARIYNRALTDEEVYHNYLIDKERFGLE